MSVSTVNQVINFSQNLRNILDLIGQICDGLQANDMFKYLLEEGQLIFNSIKALILDYPYVALGVVVGIRVASGLGLLLYYLPTTMFRIAIWIASLRLAWDSLHQSVHLPVDQLSRFVVAA